jgi:hypothetical protein
VSIHTAAFLNVSARNALSRGQLHVRKNRTVDVIRSLSRCRLLVRRAILLATGLAVSIGALFAELSGAFDGSPDHPAIGYPTQPANDAVAELNRKIQRGTAQLRFDDAQGYLRSVLEALNVPIESQMVVFSRTSVQANRISPRNPRTLFFNDSVAVGWVRGGFIELAAQDPKQGAIFYTLDQSSASYQERLLKLPVKPMFVRNDTCLGCHVSYATLDVPGMLVRSVFTQKDGQPIRRLGDYVTDQRSPFEERWGGWYVTGKTGSVRHMGNVMISDPDQPEPRDMGETLGSLKEKFDTLAYLSPYSDIVALMTFEHQMRMMNLLTRVGWEARFGLYQEQMRSTLIAQSPIRNIDLATRLREAASAAVDYMLFVDEAPLASKLQGTSGFTEKFAVQGPIDSKGRSLRQFDLEQRLMHYPCSYMIYSEAFDGLPTEAKEAIYKRIWQILSGGEKDAKYTRLSLADRQAIVEILRDTKKGLPDYFQPVRQ